MVHINAVVSWWLTEKGRKALGVADGESGRHGGPEHRYWVKAIADHLRVHGFDVAEEAPIGGGKTEDVLAEQDGKRIAFEIETGKSDARGNVQKRLRAGMDAVVVVSTRTAIMDRLVQEMPNNLKVELLTYTDVLKRSIW